MLAASASGASSLSFSQLLTVLGIAAVVFIIVGLIVLWGRSRLKTRGETEQSLVRSWLALILVLGLVLFSGVALFLSDTNLRSVLIGGLTASAGTAVAFYFSSKAADQARQDILNAAFGTETVPDLKGSTREVASSRLGQTSFQLVVDPASSTAEGATVDSQMPLKDSQVRKGSQVVVKLVNGASSPSSTGQSTPSSTGQSTPSSTGQSTPSSTGQSTPSSGSTGATDGE
jgi:hypothetical protein